jgi:pimeloyl-ACP methyl ester carboxylesterase
MKNIVFILLFLISSAAFSQNAKYNGSWKGEIKNQDTSFVVNIGIFSKFDNSGEKYTIVGGMMYKPELCALQEIPFNDSILQLRTENIRFKLKPATTDIEFKGMLTSDKNKMSGDFTYRGKIYKIDLRRGDKVIFRPQEPKKPFPYISEEIKFQNKKDSVTLAGTLTIPNKEGCFPAVILITGSTPSNRNGESYYHQKEWVLADYLTRNGIVVLRYDSRGVDESTGNFYASTAEDLAGDINAAYNVMSERKEIDKTKIGLIGHSGGGIVASIAASINPDIGFLILMASPGIGGKDNFIQQTDLLFKAGDFTTEQHTFMKEFLNKGYKMIEQEVDKKVITDTLSSYQNKYLQCFFPSGVKPENLYANLSFSLLVKRLITPYHIYLIRCHPSYFLQKVRCPVISLNGSKDILVPSQINQNAIREALTKGGNPDFIILEMKGLNHSFQECKTGSIKESLELEQTISPKAMAIIAEWIKKHSY